MKKKKILWILCLVMSCFYLIACGQGVADEGKPGEESETPEKIPTQHTEGRDPTVESGRIDVIMTVGNKAFPVKFYENQTTQALAELLPMTMDMDELNGNEKFYYLPDKLPTAPERPGQIHAGDIMLYGDDCLVVFYKTFSSSFRYIPLGFVEDAASLAQAVGDGTIKVTLESKKSE